MRRLFLMLALSAGCTETGVLNTYPLGTLELKLDSPLYGSFAGDDPIRVKGTAGTGAAVVVVEGRRVLVEDDGTFDVLVPVEGPYRIIDVEASLLDGVQSERIPVFNGFDPSETWPGGLSARLTTTGLDGIASLLGAVVDGIFDPAALADILPSDAGGGVQLTVVRVDRLPTSVTIEPEGGALTAAIRVVDLELELLVEAEVVGFPIEVPVVVTVPEIEVALAIHSGVGENGEILFSFGEPNITFEPLDFAIGGVGLGFLVDLLDNAIDLETLLDEQIGNLLGDLGEFSLGQGLDFETDLLGTSLAIRLTEITTDELGVGIGLGVGLGEPAPDGPSPVPPPPGDFDPGVDLSIAVHEGILQPLLQSDLLDLLEQDFRLEGLLAGLLGNLITNLPGGDQAPDAEGWCLGLTPGDAKVARFTEGNDPLLAIYLPDAVLDFGRIETIGGECVSWLETSLALEVGLGVTEGTVLGISIAAPEGKVLHYGAVGIDEEELIERIGGLLSGLLDLVGGFAEIDLADILGGGNTVGDGAGLPGDGGGLIPGLDLANLQIEVRGAKPILDAQGKPQPGLFEVGVQLFGDPE